MAASCDTCSKPGACCREILISGKGWEGQAWQSDWAADALRYVGETMPEHPFTPVRFLPYLPEFSAKDVPVYGLVFWSCRNLTPEGRCGDYENRPQLCRDYQAGSDPLCVEHVKTFRGIPIVTSN